MYLGYQNGKIKFYTEEMLNANIYQLERIEYTDKEYVLDGEEYVLKDEAWEEKQTQKEQERIAKLSLTRGDLFEALILAFGKDENDIIQIVETMTEIDDITKKIYINRIKNALDFYRGYPAVDMIGQVLGITKEQMDIFFETKDWNSLIVAREDI